MEHIAGLRNPVLNGKEITFVLSKGRFVSLTDQVVIVHDYHEYNSTADCYIVNNSVDWEGLRACLHIVGD